MPNKIKTVFPLKALNEGVSAKSNFKWWSSFAALLAGTLST